MSDKEETPVFSTRGMYKFGGGDEHFVSYDFSILNYEKFEPFFNTLPNMIYKKIERVSFSCQLDAECGKAGKVDQKRLDTLKDSILLKKPTFLPYLIKILTKTLPKTKRLISLEFVSMKIPSDLMIALFDAIGTCKTLQRLYFKNVKTKDEDFQHLLKLISPYQYKSISFINCSLTSASFEAIKEFIERTPEMTSQYVRTIKEFNVDDCNFTFEELNTIEELVNEARKDAEKMPKPGPDETQVSYEINDHTIKRLQERNLNMNDGEDSPIKLEKESSSSDDGAYCSSHRQAMSYASQTRSYKSMSKKPKPKPVMPIKIERVPTTDEFASKDIFELPNYSYPPHVYRHFQNQQEEDAKGDILLNFDLNSLPNPNDLNEDELKKQNQYLQEILDNYIKKYRVVQYADDVFLVGEGAQDMNEVIKLMKDQMKEYEQVRKEEEQYKEGRSKK